MPLTMRGLAKLVEECGELSQIAAKKMTCMDSDWHWDGNGSLKDRLEDEIADVLAAVGVVSLNFGLDDSRMAERVARKMKLFMEWDAKKDDPPKKGI